MKSSNVSTQAGSGFAMQFANGIHISVQFSAAHYCSNRDTDASMEIHSSTYRHMQSLYSPNAEVLIWNDDRDLELMGHVSVEEIGRLIGACQSASSLDDVEKEILND